MTLDVGTAPLFLLLLATCGPPSTPCSGFLHDHPEPVSAYEILDKRGVPIGTLRFLPADEVGNHFIQLAEIDIDTPEETTTITYRAW